MALDGAERIDGPVFHLGEVDGVGEEGLVKRIDARRQEPGGKDLFAARELHDRSGEIAAVHQAEEPDHRQSGIEIVEISEAEEQVEKNGGNLLGSVSAKLNYLVVGEDAGSKLDKAKKVGTVNIISEEEFVKMIS